ncbi:MULTISPECIES: Cof-type HAD-IIB family hydrolase [unclassified Virgibacillus]|uniref:Cof-type HAD-IIB family hydrolase n=1 Tax=unclassified Virgibacillus TaxID=2620237 RepID=UPI0024DEE973|nr:Cof-type HAD-IIB family hydrolase [Virgibacillus sp. LDC-1]
MTKNIVFFDIDGTLLNDAKQIPSSAKKAIQALQKTGVMVAIATGRAPFMFKELREELGIDSFVSFNGQYVVLEGKTIYENPLEKEELIHLYEAASREEFPMIFMHSDEMRASVENHPYIEKSMVSTLKFDYPPIDTTYYDKQKIYQALLFCKDQEERKFRELHHAFDFIRWHDVSCDVLPGGASKAIGIKKLIEAYGVDIAHTYAFGDGLNDIEMIREVGTGVAMGNAVAELKEIADYVTDPVNQGGIANGLKHLQLI